MQFSSRQSNQCWRRKTNVLKQKWNNHTHKLTLSSIIVVVGYRSHRSHRRFISSQQLGGRLPPRHLSPAVISWRCARPLGSCRLLGMCPSGGALVACEVLIVLVGPAQCLHVTTFHISIRFASVFEVSGSSSSVTSSCALFKFTSLSAVMVALHGITTATTLSEASTYGWERSFDALCYLCNTATTTAATTTAGATLLPLLVPQPPLPLLVRASGTQLVAGRLSAVRANRLARDGWRLKTSSSSSCWRHRFALARDVAWALLGPLRFEAIRFAPTRFREASCTRRVRRFAHGRHGLLVAVRFAMSRLGGRHGRICQRLWAVQDGF